MPAPEQVQHEFTASIQKRLKIASYMKPGQDASIVAEDITIHGVLPIFRQFAQQLKVEPNDEARTEAREVKKMFNDLKDQYIDLEKLAIKVGTLDKRTADWREALDKLCALGAKIQKEAEEKAKRAKQ